MLIENKKGTLVKYKIHTLFSISSQNVRVKSQNTNSQFAKIVQTLKQFLLKEISASGSPEWRYTNMLLIKTKYWSTYTIVIFC